MYIKGNEIRLIGLRLDNLTDKEEMQINLFDKKENEKQKKIDQTIDKLKEKYGYNSITRAGRIGVDKLVNFKKN